MITYLQWKIRARIQPTTEKISARDLVSAKRRAIGDLLLDNEMKFGATKRSRVEVCSLNVPTNLFFKVEAVKQPHPS